MIVDKINQYIQKVLDNRPSDWLNLTTHRLDIYDENLAKVQFLDQYEELFQENIANSKALHSLPTAYDYIRLGHPLSCILEWAIAKLNYINSEQVISFSSKTIPIMAVLRENQLLEKNTQIVYTGSLPESFNADTLKNIYNYSFDIIQVDNLTEIPEFEGSTIYVSEKHEISHVDLTSKIDFCINTYKGLGSVIVVNGVGNDSYIAEIQHVRRRESIAMTPSNCLLALEAIAEEVPFVQEKKNIDFLKKDVVNSIQKITATNSNALVASSGLSMQYAIVMGLIHDAVETHPGKDIKIVVPPNCYGGTNDQARRVSASLPHVSIVDLLVDGDNDMVQSVDQVLSKIAEADAIPFIIAEIPTNPRVEVPDLFALKNALSKSRETASGSKAIEPVFILDQTFCPNVHFLGDGEVLANVKTISYVSGSKFPSGGKCTAGYCVANKKAELLMTKIDLHLKLCDNEATDTQVEILAKQLPSMNQRIQDAYLNTREFVNFIKLNLPKAKINFVSEELAEQGFTPSVFSLDLPTKGDTDEEREAYKRNLNLKLIHLMIEEIPDESKYCVSYGQLQGCYWTIPATSTQGTTKEGDKDYIARVALSPNMDMARHQEVFLRFVKEVL